jgi:putative ABC transport system permease protein
MFPMLAKLSIRNMKRSIRDYGIYILTLTIAFAFIYAYNMISFSNDIMMLSKQMEGFRDMNLVMSALIIFVIAWLINYILGFMIKNRGREFATYLLLGIKNSAISRMFFIENLLLGMVSLLLGILFGSVLYQVFALIIMKTFQIDYKPSSGFSLKALELSIIYEIGMLLLLLLMNSRKFR